MASDDPNFGVVTWRTLLVRSAYSKWSGVPNSRGLTGPEVGQHLIQSAGLQGVRLERVPGELTDHFDPRENVVRMSDSVVSRPSVASMAIVAHELGHAQQYQARSPLIALRSFLLPAVQFSPTISYMLIFAGFMFNATGLIQLGALFFGVVVVFMILTLPVEVDASIRGLRILRESGLIGVEQDITGARSVLIAAALTYFAAAITSVLQLLYYLSLASRRN